MADDLRTFAADLSQASHDVVRKSAAVVKKGATNIKAQMREEARGSRHFKIERSITYDATGKNGLSAVIGPKKDGAGNLANIAYFGGVNGGGGTLPDPQGALDTEAPKFERALLDVATEGLT